MLKIVKFVIVLHMNVSNVKMVIWLKSFHLIFVEGIDNILNAFNVNLYVKLVKELIIANHAFQA
jgi:hypothetical protein